MSQIFNIKIDLFQVTVVTGLYFEKTFERCCGNTIPKIQVFWINIY